MTKEQRKLIKECLVNFDFEAVHRYMEDIEWSWVDIDSDQRYIPSTIQLYIRAEELLEDAVAKNATVSSCGLCAMADNDGVELCFVIAMSCATYPIDENINKQEE